MPRSSFAKTFFRIFPPPAFINMPYAGVDISDTAVHCLEFRKGPKRGSVVLGRYDMQAIPAGVVEGGYIKDEEALVSIVAGMVKKLGIIRVRASLPEEKVYLFRTDILSLDTKEIAQNIESKLEENVPLSPADAIFHFKIIPAAGATSPRASVSVVPTKVVETYIRVFRKAGVMVASFEMQARAVAHALIVPDSQEAVMIVYAQNAKAGIYIVHRGVVCFTVTISLGNDISGDVSRGMKEVAAYWSDHGESPKILNRVIVCGPDPQRTAVENAAAELKLPVTPANIWTNAFSTEHVTPSLTAGESASYAAAAGLALPRASERDFI